MLNYKGPSIKDVTRKEESMGLNKFSTDFGLFLRYDWNDKCEKNLKNGKSG